MNHSGGGGAILAMNQERFSEGGRTLAIFEGGKDLRSNGRTFKEKKPVWTKAQGKLYITRGKEMQFSYGLKKAGKQGR